ncbi:ubiquitin-conjugating enzyme E2 [Streptomyces subrutilus]|uniref:UBC core domain-containing protein n=1 Tax=Streptomyces subrutilus TaxID=36818 RepID=A0A1E5PKK4_9ACTN|nr:ubiquitin-conjugating enzyme E2 [Streptomyces subrutilus]OEJ30054.1 hypothetical protein BGK67_00435 [Streptomyces subrutilus]
MTSAESRLQKEIQTLHGSGATEVKVFPCIDGDTLRWRAELLPPEESMFHGRHFMVEITVPDTYPYVPPRMQFSTPLYHPNVTTDGAIVMSRLGKDWSPALSIEKILMDVLTLLDAPEMNDPVRADAADLYAKSREDYCRTAREATEPYAV